MVATGVGLSEDDAKKQAYRNAIQSVVGTMVVAETLVENDALVKDKVLSHSDGYITKVEQVGNTVAIEGGLMQVTMRVTVKSRQLQEKLQAERISVAKMDGESLVIEKITQQESAKDAAAIMAEFFKGRDLPASLVDSAANIDQAKVTEASGDSSTMTVPVTVSVNMDAYRKFIGDLKKTLTDLGFKGEPLTTEFNSKDLTGNPWYYFKEKFWKESAPTIAVCDMFSLESRRARVTFFKVPKNVLETFAAVLGHLEIKTELCDGGGNLITSQDIRPVTDDHRRSRRRDIICYGSSVGMVVVSPAMDLFCGSDHSNLCLNEDPKTLEATFMLSNDELKAAKSIKTSVYNSKPAAQ